MMKKEVKKELKEHIAPGPYRIPTPPEQADIGPTDNIAEAVEEMMDGLTEAFTGQEHKPR